MYGCKDCLGNITDIDGDDNDVDLITDQNQGIFYKMTDDYGDSWSEDGGFKNSGYQVIPDAVALRLTDSLYTVWAEEENEYYRKRTVRDEIEQGKK